MKIGRKERFAFGFMKIDIQLQWNIYKLNNGIYNCSNNS